MKWNSDRSMQKTRSVVSREAKRAKENAFRVRLVESHRQIAISRIHDGTHALRITCEWIPNGVFHIISPTFKESSEKPTTNQERHMSAFSIKPNDHRASFHPKRIQTDPAISSSLYAVIAKEKKMRPHGGSNPRPLS